MSQHGQHLGFLALQIRLWDLVAATGAILSAAAIAGFCGRFWWFFDLFSHFRVQYFFGLGLVALMLLMARRFKSAGLFCLLAIVNAATIAPLYFGRPGEPALTSPVFRGMLMNVNTQSGQPVKVAVAIQE